MSNISLGWTENFTIKHLNKTCSKWSKDRDLTVINWTILTFFIYANNYCSQNLFKTTLNIKDDISISIAGVRHWNRPNGSAYGVSDSLYERNPATYEQAGHPIADTFAVVARKNSAILVSMSNVYGYFVVKFPEILFFCENCWLMKT